METKTKDIKEVLFFSTAPRTEILKKLGFEHKSGKWNLKVSNGSFEIYSFLVETFTEIEWKNYLDKLIKQINFLNNSEQKYPASNEQLAAQILLFDFEAYLSETGQEISRDSINKFVKSLA